MTDHRFTLLDALTAVLIAGLAAAAAWIAVAGPSGPVPMHFDAAMQPDRWGDRSELAMLIGFMAVMTAVTAGGMGRFAARAVEPSRRRGLRVGQLVSLLAIGGASVLILWASLSHSEGAAPPVAGLGMALTGLIFAVTGAFLGRVAPNPLVGVRTPWAFKSRLAWDRSNRLAGRLFFWLGVLAVVAAPFAPQPAGIIVVVVGVLIAALWSIVESWRVWRTDPDRQPF
ncbi:hypothetical protein ASG17_13280 [Brevundimonas sp. Leaf363]|uniref:SdpI family protein n=1 Tax=Brevundimonas sp. Leaf363 TaxID=1736353 RepID=UPI0006F71C98|nr:SdpI family protein [Brevundimonas sp. Leaf363]KQS53923.1 hypothetical protein ASG17_13280 [Brevundimonas sp. Leaf363]